MKVGTKSLLFGVHQLLWHPFIVARAWHAMYGWPSWRVLVCIVVHDWGYWGCEQMDDEHGEQHPYVGSRIAGALFGLEYATLVLWHSRHLARRNYGVEPSALCWPDKLSLLYDPEWFYLFRARLSGELREYRQRAADAGVVPNEASDHQWFQILRERFERLARERRGDVVSYVNPERK